MTDRVRGRAWPAGPRGSDAEYMGMESLRQGGLLLVDDEPAQADALAGCLERAGYNVLRAHSGADALQLIRIHPVDLVLLDVMMPGMSGLETLQVIRQRSSAARLPVIMLTASDRTDDVVEALDLGANDYLTKPVELAVAMARVRTHVACCRSESARRGQDGVADADDTRLEGLWEWSRATGRLHVSAAWRDRLGWGDEATDATMDDWLDRVHEGDAARVRAEFDAHLRGVTPRYVSEHRLTHPDGTFTWVLMRGAASRDHAGHVNRVAGSFADLTHSRFTDPLTGLPNRASCVDKLQRLLRPGATAGRNFAVLAVDLDRFSHVNERLGHAIGDQVLLEVGRRFAKALRTTDLVTRHLAPDAPATLARVGGDEFTLLIDQLPQPADAVAVAERLLTAVSGPCLVSGSEVALSASIGLAYATSAHARPDDVLREADAALRHAKGLGGDRIEVFSPALWRETERHFLFETDLRWALERGELALRFAPVVRAGGGELAGVIADVYWNSPSRGVLPADAFLPFAEACGLIVPLERWVLREACTHMARWQAAGTAGAPLLMHVPTSLAQCVTDDLVEHLRGVLRETGLTPDALVLDLDDRLCVVVDDSIAHTLMDLRASGVRLGAGHPRAGGTLAGLARHPFDGLTVRASSLLDQDGDGEGEIEVPEILRVARSLAVRVTVVDIDTQEQLERVRELGGTFASGLIIGAPLAPHEFEPIVRCHTRPGDYVAVSVEGSHEF